MSKKPARMARLNLTRTMMQTRMRTTVNFRAAAEGGALKIVGRRGWLVWRNRRTNGVGTQRVVWAATNRGEVDVAVVGDMGWGEVGRDHLQRTTYQTARLIGQKWRDGSSPLRLKVVEEGWVVDRRGRTQGMLG
jgi:hypothetical protein